MTLKEIAKERSQGRCEICGSRYMVQIHHIVHGRGKRKQCETEESLIAVCWDHHHGDKGVHGRDGHTLDIKLKQRLQKRYEEQGRTEEEVRELMGGKLY